jgi:hypothetical protein
MHDWIPFPRYCKEQLHLSHSHGLRLVREGKLEKPIPTHPDGKTKYVTPEMHARNMARAQGAATA